MNNACEKCHNQDDPLAPNVHGFYGEHSRPTCGRCERGYCEKHQEAYQELWPGDWLCESCFVEHFHYADDGAKSPWEEETEDHDCKSGCPCGKGNDDD